MDRNLERNVDYAKDGIDSLVAEIERLESENNKLQDVISEREEKIEYLEDYITDLLEKITG